MKTLLVTVDTEPDDQWCAEKRTQPTLENLKSLQRFQACLDRHRVKPTYLVTHAVVKDEAGSRTLKTFVKSNRCEVGAHLHPWDTPPGSFGPDAPYPHQLSAPLEREKLRVLTEAIQKRFSVSPGSYRAGRYGLGDRSVTFLEEMGYRVDSSTTPWMRWDRDGGRDFTDVNPQPHILKREDGTESGILEVPISIGPSRLLSPRQARSFRRLLKFPRLEGAFQRLGLKVLWLRPSTFTLEEMKHLSDLLLAQGHTALTMMLHSSELYPGTSPHHKTSADVDRCFDRLEGILDYLVHARGLTPLTLSEFGSTWRRPESKTVPVHFPDQKKAAVLNTFETHVEEWKRRYHETKTFHTYNFLTRRRWVMELLGPGEGKVLDVGCGTGDYIADLLEHGYQAFGCDNALGMIKTCRERWGESRFFVGDVESLPVSPGTYDAVIGVGLIQYLKDDEQALQELARILKPGGKLILTVPLLSSPFILADYVLFGVLTLASRFLDRVGLYQRFRGSRRRPGKRFLNRYYLPGALEKRLVRAGLICTDRVGCAFGSMLLLSHTPLFIGFSRWLEKFSRSVLRTLGSSYIVKAEKPAVPEAPEPVNTERIPVQR